MKQAKADKEAELHQRVAAVEANLAAEVKKAFHTTNLMMKAVEPPLEAPAPPPALRPARASAPAAALVSIRSSYCRSLASKPR